jgi:uridine kinase
MNPLIIGIAGGTGSGKTSVTNRIIDSLDCSRVLVLQHDSYYKDIGTYGGLDPLKINFDHPDSLETSLLIEHLRALRSGKAVEQPLYNFTTHQRMSSTKTLMPKEIIIVEGILIFVDRDLRDLMDIKMFIDTDADERLIRRMRRDIVERGRSMDSVLEQYVQTVKPMHLEFVEPSKHWADIIIPRGSENTVAIDMVVTKISMMLARGGGAGIPGLAEVPGED